MRKGNVPQGLNHQEWFGVAIQLPGNQPISGLLRRKADPSKKLPTSNKLKKTTSKPDELITQQTHTVDTPTQSKSRRQRGRERERKKHIPAGDPKQCGEAEGDETGGGDDDDDDAQMKTQRSRHIRAHIWKHTEEIRHMRAHR